MNLGSPSPSLPSFFFLPFLKDARTFYLVYSRRFRGRGAPPAAAFHNTCIEQGEVTQQLDLKWCERTLCEEGHRVDYDALPRIFCEEYNPDIDHERGLGRCKTWLSLHFLLSLFFRPYLHVAMQQRTEASAA